MTWTAHYFDRQLNSDAVSRACASKEDALRLACDMIRRNCIVHLLGSLIRGSGGAGYDYGRSKNATHQSNFQCDHGATYARLR